MASKRQPRQLSDECLCTTKPVSIRGGSREVCIEDIEMLATQDLDSPLSSGVFSEEIVFCL